MNQSTASKPTTFRWTIVGLLFLATTVNYLDRQVLSLTWKDFIQPEFHWDNNDYGNITALFSIFYAASMIFAGKFVDFMDTKKGFLWAIGVWSIGAVLHAFCGIATSGIVTGEWFVSFEGAKENIATVKDVSRVINVSVTLFIFARLILAIGEAGNFPAAIKTTAEYFPKKDRALATSIFNAGATVGALAAPISIPFIAKALGWEMAFIIIGALGFLWMGIWVFYYKKPHEHSKVNQGELDYINQDINDSIQESDEPKTTFTLAQCFKYRQTWAFAFGKFMTDGVWWFYLFWTPAYLSSVYGMDSTQSAFPLFVLYMITLVSIVGGWLPTFFVEKKGMNPYSGRMKAMLIFAFFPLLALLAQSTGKISYWFPVLIIGIAGAAHQAWSANIFSTVGDMFPKKAIATITGIGGLAGGIGSTIINKSSGLLFDYSHKAWTTVDGVPLLEKFPQYTEQRLPEGFFEQLQKSGAVVSDGIDKGYMIIFSFCAVAYLIAWFVMKSLVPTYKIIKE
ncbi:MFS transporter [Epilithonimonas ginsengisoli]|uniref:MFS transporter n=1 Tax=Epilithonimonas ginsengisoli TaxID=1245592 RepID=A0ABU4JF61_9FLAO|nr:MULTISPECIES: MFS transporter [Chryseobacterium group]MBV6879675.1 MFS transporter [Epilithonimonas sp. FP105]MDW8548314.1 MFS transporter [Epilithonimonas ginsengisoli]OAH72550.1 MFS transporter [Chryseobacterium sp. FP211-J200]